MAQVPVFPRRDADAASVRTARRASLRRLVALPVAVALTGLGACSGPGFQSVDISGASYGHDFQLSDPAGRMRSLADFRGKVVLLFFGFTQCPDVCPTALARAVEVKRLLGTRADRLQVIFVTIDPERDTAALLASYTHAFAPDFLGLRADPDTTLRTARDFKIFFTKVPTGSSYTMDHTAISYAFDPQGRLRLAIPHDRAAASIAADAGLLLDGR